MTESLVSLIISAYNAEKYLGRCLDSVLKQTYPALEIILVDDGSTDASGKICDFYATKDQRIHVIHQANSGISIARNNALKMATGEFLGFTDADDKLEPDYVATLVKNIRNVDLVLCGYFFVNSRGEIKKRHFDKESVLSVLDFMHTYLDDEIAIFHNIANRPIIGGYLWNKLFRRIIWGDIQFLPHRRAVDTLAVTAYISRINTIRCIPACKYYYYEVSGSITNQKHLNPSSGDLLVIRQEQRKLMQTFLQKIKLHDDKLLAKCTLLVLMAYINTFIWYLGAGQEKGKSCTGYVNGYKTLLNNNYTCLFFCKKMRILVLLLLCYFSPCTYFKIWHLRNNS
jgi:glycosyltransferase involved in cell wall biosynthesis